ncbi:MAG: radical SAM family heme chaperone HemW [Lachnospiraceae bacterium]
MSKKMELYLHIPFCMKKCNYCDFLSAPLEDSVRELYTKNLIKEIEQKSEDYRDFLISTIFIGGGTPSILEGIQINQIMEKIYRCFQVVKDAEITIECNPGTITADKLSAYRYSGINRISMGLQSTKNQELKHLGRIHTYQEFLENYDLVRKAGFHNVNLDIMSALPNQTLDDWEDTLKEVVKLRPEHISAYSLIIEEGTPFYQLYAEEEQRRERGEEPQFLPSEETERAMYQLTKEFLKEKGYWQYEISNYAQKNKECNHNIGYWTRENYLGLGLGSASLIENLRFSNTTNLSDYLAGDWAPKNMEQITRKFQMEEFMFLGLRLMQGVSRRKFKETFQVEIEAVYGVILQNMFQKELLNQTEGNIYLTTEGIALSNYVMSEFLME